MEPAGFSDVLLAGLAAGLSLLTPWLNQRWRRAAWIVLLTFLVVRLIDGLLVPVDALLIVSLGYAVGAGVLLAFGAAGGVFEEVAREQV